jgi:hypothetical protein
LLLVGGKLPSIRGMIGVKIVIVHDLWRYLMKKRKELKDRKE